MPTSGRRLAYARHLVDGRHPLVGRVLVNRIWLHHFGRGLVETPGDFGVLGTRPTHPELLDWLADELVRQGWSLKRMHRLIMTSTAYRQSSRRDVGRTRPMPTTRCTAVSRSGGSTPKRSATASWPSAAGSTAPRSARRCRSPRTPSARCCPANDSARRSLYLQVRRTKPVSLLAAFDAPIDGRQLRPADARARRPRSR